MTNFLIRTSMRLKAIYDLSDEPYYNEMIRSNECYLELLCADIYDKPRVPGTIEITGTGMDDKELHITANDTIVDINEYLSKYDIGCVYDERNNRLIISALSGYNRFIKIGENLAKNLGLPTSIELRHTGDTVTSEFAPRGIRYIVLKSEDITMTDTQAEGLDTKTLCIFTPGNNFSYVNYNVADQITIASNKTMRFSLVDNFGNTITDRKCCVEFILDNVKRHEKTSGYFRIGQRHRMPKNINKVALAEVVPLARTKLLTEEMLVYYVITYNETTNVHEDKAPGTKLEMTNATRYSLADYDRVRGRIDQPITKDLFKDIADAITYAGNSQIAVAGYNAANNGYVIVMKSSYEGDTVYDWRQAWRTYARAMGLSQEEIEEKALGSRLRSPSRKKNVMLYFPPQSILTRTTTRQVKGKNDYILISALDPYTEIVDGYQVPTFHKYLSVGNTGGRYIDALNFTSRMLAFGGYLINFPEYEDHLDLHVNDTQICRLNYEDGLLRQKNIAYFEMIDLHPTCMLQATLQTKTRQPKDANDCFIKLFLK